MTLETVYRGILRVTKSSLKWMFISWVILFFAFAPYRFWETRKVEALCAEIKPGLPVGEVRSLVEKYGLNTSWVLQEPHPKSDGTFVWLVPTTSSLGQDRCVIVRDKSVVISASVDLD